MPRKINRSAFLYMDPIGSGEAFAQCGTCRFWKPSNRVCALFVSSSNVSAGASCGLYVYGAPSDLQSQSLSVYSEDAGFETRQMRCENCFHFYPRNQGCSLYKSLNEKEPDKFQLDIHVHPQGCCNANTPKE